MKLYVCWGTFQTVRPGGHPCRNAYKALRDAGQAITESKRIVAWADAHPAGVKQPA